MMRGVRLFRWLMAAFGLVVSLSTMALADPLNIRVGWSTMPGHMIPVLFGPDKPYLKHYGQSYTVEPVLFRGSSPQLTALAAGEIDLIASSPATMALAVLNAGIDVRLVADIIQDGMPGYHSETWLVKTDSGIKTAADLKGKRIATGRGSIGHYLLLRVLEREGLTPNDVTIVFLSPGDAKAAFNSGAVDAWVTWNPYVGLAQLHDKTRIVADGQGLLHSIGFEVASDRAIATKRAELTDFLARLAKAEAWEGDHKAEYAAVLAKETGLPEDVAVYTVSKARGVVVPIDASVVNEERDTLSHYVKAGVVTSAPNIDGAFDTSFYNAGR